MGFGINGNDFDKNLFVGKNFTASSTSKVNNTEPPINDNKVKGEYGDKLLEQVQPQFVTTSRISKTDAVELNEIFELAGIKNPKMPTVAQYQSVSNHVATITQAMDELTTTINADNLYNSTDFKVLNEIFGIT